MKKILEKKFFKLKAKSNFFISWLYYIVFLSNINTIIFSECEYDYPIKKNGGNCIAGGCSDSEFETGVCTIENEIISIQWLNNRIKYSENSINYAAIATTPKGNLICSASYFSSSNKKYYFGLKSNGRPFFLENGIETVFSETDSDKPRNEGNIYGINLANDDKEYIIGFGNNRVYVEIYDFQDNNNIIIYKRDGATFFKTEYNPFQRAAIFNLKNSPDYYIISIIAQAPSSNGKKSFYIMKLLFTSLDITGYSPIIASDRKDSADIKMSSCFETGNNYIFCFYLDNSDNYVAIVYDSTITEKKSSSIASNMAHSSSVFYKCVHFTGEAGAFLYYNEFTDIEIQFKKYESDNIENYFNSQPIISITNNNIYNNQTKLNDMIKLDEKKFCFIVVSLDCKQMNIFIINNYLDEKIKIRHYKINIHNLYIFRITDELKITLYNNLIAMASTDRLDNNVLSSYVTIFSYPNSEDFSLDITDNLITSWKAIINFYEQQKIENNIFGYIFAGVKIIDISQGYKLTSVQNRSEIIINDNDFLYNNDSAELEVTKDVNIGVNGRITYAIALTEPAYEIFNEYTVGIIDTFCGGNQCNDEKNYFKNNLYIGRHSYFDIIINPDRITTNCEDIENCAVCVKNTLSCITCKYLYRISDESKKICLNEGVPAEIETTILNIPTTIITTEPIIKTTILNIPTTIITTEPIIKTTIITTEQKMQTTILNIPTTIITTEPIIETTIVSTPTTIIATEPKMQTTILNIPTTIFTTVPKIQSTILNNPTTIITTEPKIQTTILNIPTTIINTIGSIIETTILKISTTIINIDNSNKNNQSECSNEEIIRNKCSGEITIEQAEEIKSEILNENYTKENTIIRTKNVVIQLSKLEDQQNEEQNISNIDLGECEDKLKKAYNIPKEESLIIYKTDIKKEGYLSTYVAFEVYDPFSLEKLNVSICNGLDISINVPVEMDSNIEYLYKSLDDYGYNLFNKTDTFYNDICSKFTTANGTDILLSDRKKDMYAVSQTENNSICQNGCLISSYNISTKKAKCDCPMKNITTKPLTNVSIENQFDIKIIEETFFNSLSNSNFRVLKCYMLVFDVPGMTKNIGLIIMSVVFFIFIILAIIFTIKSQKQIQNYIKFILHLKNSNNPVNLKRKSFNKIKRKLSAKIKPIKSSKNIKSKATNLEKLNILSKKGKSKSKKRPTESPPKKKVVHKSSKILNRDVKKVQNKRLNHALSNRPINNNILLNVQVIKPKIQKKRNTIYSPNNKHLSAKMNRKISMKSSGILASESNTRKSLNNNSRSLFKQNEKSNKEKFDPKEFRLLNDYEINNLEYIYAIKVDNRSYCQYYWSLLRQKQIVIFPLCQPKDYNIVAVKISLFFISFSLYFTINGFFFNDSSMHILYKNNGDYGLIDRLPQMIYSTLVSTVVNMILKKLSLSERNILEIKEEKEYLRALEKSKNIESTLKLKFVLFFIISFLLMMFFWYFISCFCAVFTNTQIILIKDTLISFGLSMIYPFGYNLLPGIFRIPALRKKDSNKECIYKFGQVLSLI